MPRDSSATREKILDAALALVMDLGFGATSIDSVIDKAGITKGTFFYHFKTKQALARALIQRFAQQDLALLDTFATRAAKLSRDPLQQLLIFLGLFIEMFDNLKEVYPGCLFASFCYQSGLVSDDINAISVKSLLAWRGYLLERFADIEKQHPLRENVDPTSLADLFTTVLEGAFILSRMLDDPKLIARHLQHYRQYVEMVFSA